MDFISEKLTEYISENSNEEPKILARLNQETHQKILKPRMLSGHIQGRLLSMISKMNSPSSILEIGTFTGYSALCLAKGLAPSGFLHTIESRLEDAQTANNYFKQSKYANQIKLHIGDAKEIIPTLQGMFDLVFIDADKTGYIEYYEMVVPLLAKGGVIIADNVLFHGEVLEENISGKIFMPKENFNNRCFIFVHGDGDMGIDAWGFYRPYFEEFSQRGRCSLSWEKPLDRKSQTMEERAQEVDAAVNFLNHAYNLEKIIVIGWSQSAWVMPYIKQKNIDGIIQI